MVKELCLDEQIGAWVIVYWKKIDLKKVDLFKFLLDT